VWFVLFHLHPMVIYIKDHKTTMMKNHITSKDANVCSWWNIVNVIILTKEASQERLWFIIFILGLRFDNTSQRIQGGVRWLGIQHLNYDLVKSIWSWWSLIMKPKTFIWHKNQVHTHNRNNFIMIKRLLILGSKLDWFENHKGLKICSLNNPKLWR